MLMGAAGVRCETKNHAREKNETREDQDEPYVPWRDHPTPSDDGRWQVVLRSLSPQSIKEEYLHFAL
jgi:hypothetical protein